MSKILLLGPAGCGKTTLVLKSFQKTLSPSDSSLNPKTFFIVPSVEHTERVVSLLVQNGVKGFFNDRVTTLSGLIKNIFSTADFKLASKLLQSSIVRNLLRDGVGEYFRGMEEKTGLLNLLLKFITEVKDSFITPEDFRERMNTLKRFENASAAKYETLASFYEGYEEELGRRGFLDKQDILKLFIDQKKKNIASPIIFDDLWIDGFFDFSNIQIEYLKEISLMTKNITVTLTAEDDRRNSFESIEATRKNLLGIGFKIREMEAPSFRTKSSSFRLIQENLFSEKRQKLSQKFSPKDIMLLDAVGREGEIELIARKIHELKRKTNWRYSDFAVLFRQIGSYARIIRFVFSRYDIPVEIHERERLKLSPWIQTVLSFLFIFQNGWRREDIFTFLKSSYVKTIGLEIKDIEWINELERKAILEGVLEGKDDWVKSWNVSSNKKEASSFNFKKNKIVRILEQFETNFTEVKSTHEWAKILKKAVFETFSIFYLSDKYTNFIRRDAASAKRFEALLRELETYFARTSKRVKSWDVFSDYFLKLVELDLYSIPEKDKNCVQIYDISLARQKEYKTVFVAGLLEGNFPLQIREDPILSDWERRLINGGIKYPLNERLPHQSIERYFFYLAVTRAKELLFLSFPRIDFEGKESLPSFYIEEIRSLFSGEIKTLRQSLTKPYPALEEALSQREVETSVLGTLWNAQINTKEKNRILFFTLNNLLKDSESKKRIEKSMKVIETKLRDVKIGKLQDFKVSKISPTRLEEYAKCPFMYFSHRILKLQNHNEDFNARRKGSMLHLVLEKYFESGKKKGGRGLKGKGLEKFIKAELERALREHKLTHERKYRYELDKKELYLMLLSFIRNEIEKIENSDLTPHYFEYNFGIDSTSSAPALEIKWKKRKIKIRGKIDRIDLDKSKKSALIIDYKRSANFKRKELDLGIALQLPLYIMAVQKNLGLNPLGGEFYSIKDRKRKGFYLKTDNKKQSDVFLTKSEFQAVLDKTCQYVDRFVTEIEDMKIPVKPRKCEMWCPYGAICRIEKWRLPEILKGL